MEFIFPLIYNPLLTWEMPKFHFFFKKQWWSARAATATKVRILHWLCTDKNTTQYISPDLAFPLHTVLCQLLIILTMAALCILPQDLCGSLSHSCMLTGTSFLSFRMGTLGGMVDCLSAGLALSPLWGEFSPLPTTTTTTTDTTDTTYCVWVTQETERAGKRQRDCVCACEALKTKKAKINMTHLQKHLI